MDTKNRLIQKLLKVAKRHKFLTYPILALVAIISVISNLFSWGTGAGKRVVAVIMVMVMLVSQSYFLTSSATEAIDDEETALVQAELQEEVKNEEASSDKESDSKEQSAKTSSETSTEVAVASEAKEEKSTPAAASDSTEIIEEESMNSGASEEQASENDYAADENISITGNGDNSGDAANDSYIDEEELDSKLDPVVPAITIWGTHTSTGSGTGNTIKHTVTPNGDGTYRDDDLNSAISVFNADDRCTDSGRYRFYENEWYYCQSNGVIGKKITDADINKLVPNDKDGNGNPIIIVVSRAKLYKYFITVQNDVTDTQDGKNSPCTVTAGAGADIEKKTITENGSDVSGYLVTINENGATNVTLSGFNKYGYDIESANVGAGTPIAAAGESGSKKITVTLTGDADISLNWTGREYTVRYALDKNSATHYADRTYTYGKGEEIASHGSISPELELNGYDFDGWKVGTSGNTTYHDGTTGSVATITGELESALYDYYIEKNEPKVLYPVYVDATIGITGNADGVTISNGDRLTYNYRLYKNPVTIWGTYTYKSTGRTDTDGNFTYSFTSAGENNAAALRDKHVYINLADNGKISITTDEDGPIGTIDETTIEFAVTDNTKSPAQSKEFSIKIAIEQKSVVLDIPVDKLSKTYDGSVDATKITSPIATKDSNGKPTDVIITFTGTPQYDIKDVGATTITLPDNATAKIKDGSGEVIGNYTWDQRGKTISGCSIEPRKLFVDTKTEPDNLKIRAGEDTPFNKFTIDLSGSLNSGDGVGFVSGESKVNLGDINYSLCTIDGTPVTRNIETETAQLYSSKSTTYWIDIPEAFSDNPNYVATVIKNGKFTVEMEDPELGTNYQFGGEQAEDNDDWYYGNGSISAMGGYDTVYIYRNGVKKESGELEEADSKDDTLEIQLYDSTTHAITSKKHIGVNYDITKPEYRGYSIIEFIDKDDSNSIYDYAKKGLYFPDKGSVLDFGTFTNSTITIRVRYFDKTSGPATLKYALFGSANMTEVPFTERDDENVATADIIFYREALKNEIALKGTITCQAVDNAGNVSGPITLKPKDITGDTYDWVCEQAAPDWERLVVNASSPKDNVDAQLNKTTPERSVVVTDANAYYNNCLASFRVADSASGLERVEWYINGDMTEESPILLHNGYVQSKDFERRLESLSGKVKVKAKIYDNAGNSAETNEVSFYIDDVEPNLTVDYDDKVWTNETAVSFTTSDDLSGVDYAKVTDAEGNTIDCKLGKPDANGNYTATFDASVKGTYTVVVADKAGNTAVWNKNITNISTVVPPCPVIAVTPSEPNGNDGWYNAESASITATITHDLTSSDDTPVTAGYRLWKEGETGYNTTPISNGSVKVDINDEGIFNLQAWVKSISGVECDNYNNHIKVLKVDKTAPDIGITTEKGTGATVIVNFTVTDAVSGVNTDSIVVEHGGKIVDITKEETEEGVNGTFEISETGNYTIKASDIAGNESDEAAFTPMSLKVKAVTNITDTGATVAANVVKGTFDVKSAAISYRKYVDDTYTEAEAVVNIDPTTGNAAVSSALSELDPGTAYVYKVTATSDVNEILEYEGYFKTLTTDQSGIAVAGTARYADDSSGDITVGVFDGNVCLMAEEIEAGEEFTFVNVPDGNYSIVATDGIYSKTTRLLIEDGMIVYPTQYIDLVLSGMNTSVVLTTESTPGVTVDDMDTIFTNDTVNFTTKDSELIDAGGTVEFKLYATLMTVSAVSADEISAMYAVTDNNKVVGAYLDLSLYKIVTDADGDVDRSRVTNLQSPAHISVTIPLGELAGKPDLEVVRIHNDGENFIGASLADQDSNPSTYTITTDQFSTYAVLYSIDAGTTATSEQPATANTDASTQDIDVKVVTPTGQTGSTEPTPASSTEPTTYDDDDEDVKEIKDATKKPKASGTTTVGSLTSSGSAKTGDETPIMILFGFMMVSICGVAVLRKKSKEA
ncbi:MAG: hypothetical protein IJ661_10135 [Lachnospiraceae bacterium]|nr:hypothetical protein [Lachnospiraceae bacterium]